MNSTLVDYLFTTKAVKACKADSPFWLTSGKISMFYINADYLIGSEEVANEILGLIDGFLFERQSLSLKVFNILIQHYESSEIYKYTIDCMKDKILETVDPDEIDYISGGERRDWIFSILLSYLIGKSHITIFKDQDMWVSDSCFKSTIPAEAKFLKGKNIFHVSDLITEASSYVKYWIPAISKMDAVMEWTTTVVDEMQGGEETLSQFGVSCSRLTFADRQLFAEAYGKKVITQNQLDLIYEYLNDPYNTIRNFLLAHPEFITRSLSKSGTDKRRAEKCISENIYKLSEILK